MRLVDQNGNEYKAALDLPEAGDGFTAYAVDENGPVECIFTLQPRGGTIQVGNPPTKTTFMVGPSLFGQLEGFTSSTYVTQMSVGPQTSCTYLPPDPALLKTAVNCVLIATPTNGERARSLYIHIEPVQPKL